jgi:hypothetical protein
LDQRNPAKNSLIPLVYQGFTRTKERHILHQTEALKEEYEKIKGRVTEMKKSNENLKNQIEFEVDKASKFMMGRNKDVIPMRHEYGDVNIKKQIKRLTLMNKKRAVEIDQIKKSIRYTNFNELKIQTELLEEELKRLKTVCQIIKTEKNASIMK